METFDKVVWVAGNHVPLIIPLEQEVITQEGDIKSEPYYPDEDSVVNVYLVGQNRKYSFRPSVDGNLLTITEDASTPAGCYGIEVVVINQDGTRHRSFWPEQVVVTKSNPSVLEEWNEFQKQGVKARAALFFFAKGNGYVKPSDGIPESDLAPSVRDSIAKAKQSIQPNDLKKYIHNIVYTDWASLKEMREHGNLQQGQWYRITDFVTTTAQRDTQSAGHPFDILVMALDAATLCETAFAASHENDLYFAAANLEAWELMYCLDNDTERFAWADAVNGKGVIYSMKDEWGNKCGYDFKNIMFKRCYCEPDAFDGCGAYIAIPNMIVGPDEDYLNLQDENDFIYLYTFSCLASLDDDTTNLPAQADASLGHFQSENEMQPDYGDSPRPTNNIIDSYFVCQSVDDEPMRRVMALPNITFGQFYIDQFSYRVHDNHFMGGCHDLSLVGKRFFCNIAKTMQYSYLFYSCENSSFGDVNRSQFFGYVYNSSFGDVYRSSFGNVNRCQFFGYVDNSSFGDVYYSSFGYVVSSSFGYVDNSSFGYVNGCQFFGYVYNSSFGYVENSSFGNCNKVRGSAYLSGLKVSPATNNGVIDNVEFVGAISNKTIKVLAPSSAVLNIAVNKSGDVVQWYPVDLV